MCVWVGGKGGIESGGRREGEGGRGIPVTTFQTSRYAIMQALKAGEAQVLKQKTVIHKCFAVSDTFSSY